MSADSRGHAHVKLLGVPQTAVTYICGRSVSDPPCDALRAIDGDGGGVRAGVGASSAGLDVGVEGALSSGRASCLAAMKRTAAGRAAASARRRLRGRARDMAERMSRSSTGAITAADMASVVGLGGGDPGLAGAV